MWKNWRDSFCLTRGRVVESKVHVDAGVGFVDIVIAVVSHLSRAALGCLSRGSKLKRLMHGRGARQLKVMDGWWWENLSVQSNYSNAGHFGGKDFGDRVRNYLHVPDHL